MHGKSCSSNKMSNLDVVLSLNSNVTKIFFDKCNPSMELT